MKKRAEMGANLILRGEFNSEEANKRIGIECASFYRKGDSNRVAPGLKYKMDIWEIWRKTHPTMLMAKELNKLCAIIEPKKDIIKQIIDENGLQAEFLIAVYSYGCQGPVMCVEKPGIEMAHYLGAELVIDYYAIGDTGEKEEYDYEEEDEE